ncbi:hypothetical protein HYH02_011177 [Chlamydomonas schloesseri]|uniref:MRH domain-containing protein n=1 Tax=Chlamydomonas schloesseri TaxID=2026947 RepID=A0A835W568_9CHLO|nr:hypothetical protein HYH02_011177 [Chlamydomonas schloesseri]|eukprot:KAG2437534.1 hypothetical protein HYH02_011177 [Chlamydomonas schloesseri]
MVRLRLGTCLVSLGWLLSLYLAAFVDGAGITVITDSVSSFALPDPSEPKYIVTVAGRKGSNLEASAGTGGGEAPVGPAVAGRRVAITAVNGRRYTCTLPPDSAAGDAAATALAAAQAVAASESALAAGSSAGSSEAQAESAGASVASAAAGSETGAALGQKTPHELLEAMSALCLYRQEGLWTYEMCYKKHVRQFRQDASGRNEDFSCGKYTGDEQQNNSILLDASSTAVPIRYVSHLFADGAKCVMTGAARSAEVRFTCLPDTTDNVLVSIKEFPTCNYVFVVTTPFLCKHPLFKPAADNNLAIKCELVPSAADQREEDTAQEAQGQQCSAGEGAGDCSAADLDRLDAEPPPAAAVANPACQAGDGMCSAGGDGGQGEAAADGVAAGEGAGDEGGEEDEHDDSEDDGIVDEAAEEDLIGRPVDV